MKKTKGPLCVKCNWPITNGEQYVIIDITHVYHKLCAPLPQPAEGNGLNPSKSVFESQKAYH